MKLNSVSYFKFTWLNLFLLVVLSQTAFGFSGVIPASSFGRTSGTLISTGLRSQIGTVIDFNVSVTTAGLHEVRLVYNSQNTPVSMTGTLNQVAAKIEPLATTNAFTSHLAMARILLIPGSNRIAFKINSANLIIREASVAPIRQKIPGAVSALGYDAISSGVQVYNRSGKYEVRLLKDTAVANRVNVERAGTYNLTFNYSSKGVVPWIEVYQDSRLVGRINDLTSTTLFQDFKSVKSSIPLDLTQGDSRLRIVSRADNFYLRGVTAERQEGNPSQWIIDHLAGVPVITGTFTKRVNTGTPRLIMDADVSGGKYGFSPQPVDGATDTRVGFVNVRIHDLVSTDQYGGGIGTSKTRPATTLFLSNVTIEPNWPKWISYSSTNYDGMTLDNVTAAYGSSVTIRNWNADGAIDNKALISQFSKLTINGTGHRGLRYWKAGPHFLVQSSITMSGGAMFWVNNCSTFVLNVYQSTFNGQSRIPTNSIACENGSNPQINYLTVDPRRNGSMHPMFDND